MQSSISDRLAERFFATLLELAPTSVLDVGCGTGRLLKRCRESELDVQGLEANPERVEELQDAGFQVVVGQAEELPFDDNSFDWVVLRHVAHHLVDERPALAEAFRVARSGVLVAEPYFDVSIESQRVALRFDAWSKARAERMGRVHRANRTAAEILQAVPVGCPVDVVIEHLLILSPMPAAWLANEAAEFTGGQDEAERKELAGIEDDAARSGLSHNGTMIATLRHRRSDG